MCVWRWLVKTFALLFGLAFLWVPCLCHAWEPVMSTTGSPDQTKPRQIDQWRWKWLRPWYNNSSDSVSGTYAIIDWGQQTRYRPEADGRWLCESWRAYCWSAWRNSADGLKTKYGEGDKPL